jgi:hypothetical protein
MRQNEVLARKRALLARIQTEGAEAAYEAALAVCLDTKAPAPARATCATTILRAGGYLLSRDAGETKEPHEMTGSELEARIAELRSATSSDDVGDVAPDGPASVFD